MNRHISSIFYIALGILSLYQLLHSAYLLTNPIPQFENLSHISGRLVQQEFKCKGSKKSSIPIKLIVDNNIINFKIPCSTNIEILENSINDTIEIYYRDILLDREIWNINNRQSVAYEYKVRKERSESNISKILGLISIACTIITLFFICKFFMNNIRKKSIENQ